MRSAFLAFICLPLLLRGDTVPGQYIVELEAAPVVEKVARRMELRSAAAQSHRNRIRDEQAKMRTRLAGRRARVFGSVENVANAMFVEVAAGETAAQLRSLPGVKRVYPVREFRRVMDRVIELHRVTGAWAQIGGSESAGTGVRVAIIDTGVDATHPALRDTPLRAPEGFPRTNTDTDVEFANNKVIVARSYVNLLRRRDPDQSARDRVGHGTALAAIVAGTRSEGPLGPVTGIAPGAFIGSYKVFGSPNVNDATNDTAILKAIDDAVADGMDVINLSLGSDLAPRLEDDVEVQAIERAARLGVVVVVAAGNNGPGLNSMSSPGTAPSAITVGATTSDRQFAARIEAGSAGTFVSVNGSGPVPAQPVRGALADVAELDRGAGLACTNLPAGSLAGRIALIRRGECTFELKLTNAQAAGAVAAVVSATEAEPEPFLMGVGAATLPAGMISFQAGTALRQALTQGVVSGTLFFTRGPAPATPFRRAAFSCAGPSVENAIKPDVSATGVNVYTATQSFDRAGDMFSASGYIAINGTSFSTPVVAGAVALIKSARPGLTVEQYRSLVIHTATDAEGLRGGWAGVQQTGSGTLDVLAAAQSTLTASPSSLSFGAGSGGIAQRKTIALTNLSGSEDMFTVEVQGRGESAPVADNVRAAAGATVELPVTWNAATLKPGTYEGFVVIRSVATGRAIRVPYWHAVMAPAASITVLRQTETGRRLASLRDAILFRVVDVSGVNVADAKPEVTVLAGDGSVREVVTYDADLPGVFGVELQLGPAAGDNRFQIRVGDAVTTVVIAGT